MSTLSSERQQPTYREWIALAAEEYLRLDVLLRDLRPEEWSRPTDCSEWDVSAMVAHLIGAAHAAASPAEMVRQAAKGRRIRKHGDLVDKMNAVQVRDRVGHTPEQLTTELAAMARRGVRARSRMPAPLRALALPFGPPLGTKPLGYLMGRIYTRDAWMHRMDLCAATGRAPLLTADHDGRIVDDLVLEWSAAHGSAYSLTLIGAAGGSWSEGQNGPALALDAVAFARVLSGRGRGDGLLTTTVPF